MCGELAFNVTKTEEALAALIESDLGVAVSPILLRLWLNTRWNRVSSLAHQIHDGERKE